MMARRLATSDSPTTKGRAANEQAPERAVSDARRAGSSINGAARRPARVSRPADRNALLGESARLAGERPRRHRLHS